MHRLEILRDGLTVALTVTAYITAVLLLALFDAGLTLLLFKAAGKVKKLSRIPQREAPESNLPGLPEDAGTAVVIGGGIKKWE
jgi:hypothetical protein